MPERVSCCQDRKIPDPENAVKENLRVPPLMGGYQQACIISSSILSLDFKTMALKIPASYEGQVEAW